MRELVTVQVGQCGNQIGCRFWEMALREHAAYNTRGVYDEPLSTFFRCALPAAAGGRSPPPRPPLSLSPCNRASATLQLGPLL